ncbi:MAG: hypothetical protein H7837_04730 [Magnetococcus sp. MYC-9]
MNKMLPFLLGLLLITSGCHPHHRSHAPAYAGHHQPPARAWSHHGPERKRYDRDYAAEAPYRGRYAR